SHEASLAVPSALEGLTSGFGMGPGVSPSLWPPQLYGDVRPCRPCPGHCTVDAVHACCSELWCQAPGRLVPVICTPCGASTSGLSTQSSGLRPYPLMLVGGLVLGAPATLHDFTGFS